MPNPRTEGAAREGEARRALERAGLRFRAANVSYRVGEIDLVMDDGEAIVFVEVRYRAGADFGGAMASVGARKRQRWLRAAQAFLAAHPALARRPCRFDLIAIEGERIDWERNVLAVNRFTP